MQSFYPTPIVSPLLNVSGVTDIGTVQYNTNVKPTTTAAELVIETNFIFLLYDR